MNRPWEQDLTAAFDVLLGRPAGTLDPDDEYVLYYRYDESMMSTGLFDHIDDVGALGQVWRPGGGGQRPRVLDVCLDLGWGLDLGRSRFELTFELDSALAQAFGAVPGSNKLADIERTASGNELAAALAAHDLSPADVVAGTKARAFDVTVTYRVVTDGTLRDALLTAIRAKRGPDGLRPSEDEAATLPVAGLFLLGDGGEQPTAAVEAERDRVLAPIRDPLLRAHVWSPYLDAPWDREDDGTRIATGFPYEWECIAEQTKASPIAVWELAAFGGASLAIMQSTTRGG